MASPAENLCVQRFQSFKFRLAATADQELQMRRIAGCCRFVFNRALAIQNHRRDEGRKLMSADELALLATRSVTVSASGGDWFVSFLTERSVALPVARGPAVGIDMGVVRFATLSDGQFYTPLNSFRRHERALARTHRSVSRKKKYSNNWNKEKAKVQRVYIRIANARRDYLHKISTTISKNHALVCIEDLKVSAMSKAEATRSGYVFPSARAKRGLNKSILDQGWFEFRRQLEYKLRWNGGRLVAVSPRNTSIACPGCRHVARENRRSQTEFVCEVCGFKENADLVGAVNVLRAGHARLACAEASPAYGAMGQEPTDAFSQDH